jgi:RIP metalloprotease RseP
VTVNVLRAEGGAPSDGLSDVSAAKRTSKTFNIQPKRSDGTTQTIGIMLGPNFDRLDRLKSNNPVVALKLAWEYLSDVFTQTLLGTVSVLASLFSPSGPPPGEKISGPIGLISQGSSVVATRDWTAVLLFAAGLSVNLGVINALPIPALDGGQLVFVFAEAITGKKVDQKLQERITSFFVSVLLLLSLSTAFGDILSL